MCFNETEKQLKKMRLRHRKLRKDLVKFMRDSYEKDEDKFYRSEKVNIIISRIKDVFLTIIKLEIRLGYDNVYIQKRKEKDKAIQYNNRLLEKSQKK